MKNVKKHIRKIFAFGMIIFFSFGCSEDLGGILSDARTVEGLKEALKIGAQNATGALGQQGGFFNDETVKILLPEKAQTTFEIVNTIASNPGIQAAINAVGGSISADLKTTLEVAFNEAAEKAAPAAKDVFVEAITGMTISNGKDILFNSNKEAATDYLRSTTYGGLQTAFSPIVDESMKNVGVNIGNQNYNVIDAWSYFARQNNSLANIIKSNTAVKNVINTAIAFTSGETKAKIEQINSIDTIDESLGDYVVGEALSGIFTKVAIEETKIRTDVNARVNDLLKDVFGQLDN